MNDAEQRALAIPPAIAEAATLAPETHELIRVWWDGKQPRMMIRSTFDDPSNVGTLLAELAWHFSEAYAQRLGQDRDAILQDITRAWTAQQARFFDGPRMNFTGSGPEGASRS